MYGKEIVSPLNLYLDPKNPRFITPEAGGTQTDIRKYLITQENVLSLARSIADNKGLMPGERIVVCFENENCVVLEGNRRTCACQMFLDRSLIPSDYESRFPATSDELRKNIEQLEVDVILSREEAKRFLAVRHIERAKEWSTIAKMRFCYEDYNDGKTISQIYDRTGISRANINKYIRKYKILLRGINSSWTEEEKLKLNLLEIEPDKLLRMFELSDTAQTLRTYFDNNFVLRSNKISDADIDQIIHIWTKKAFIDDEMNTRSVFGTYNKDGECTGACVFIKHILDKYYETEPQVIVKQDHGYGNNSQPVHIGQQIQSGAIITPQPPSVVQANAGNNVQSGRQQIQGGGPSIPSFFNNLNWSAVDPNNNANKGIIAICMELRKLSNSPTTVNNFPICTAFLIRALIEHSFKYHARNKGYWNQIMRNYNANASQPGEPTLSYIIRQYSQNIRTWIPESNIRRLFNVVFNFNVQTEKLNLVVHSPESYMLTPDSLRAIPGEGLLEIANYLLR